MKLLANENIPRATIHALRKQGHDVISIAEDHPGMADEHVLRMACERERILITFDRDYGELIYRQRLPGPSAPAYLRFIPRYPTEPAEVLSRLFAKNIEVLEGGYFVLDRDSYRRRALPEARP